MREHIRLGRVAGVSVGMNWSVLAIFLLIVLGLAGGRFPALFPAEATAAYVAAGLAAGVVFFLSLLAHEVAHAVVARRNGLEVEGITLWLFGVFFAVAAGLAAAGAHPLIVDVFVWLSVINLVLAIFNLVPAAPLDGGRILRALLWMRSGDRTSAAVTAARAGWGFGWILVALGLLELLFVPGFGSVWLMLIGWFLSTAAAAEEQHARVSSSLGDVRVADVMTSAPTTVPTSMPVDRFLDEYVFPSRYSTFPVTDEGGRPVGLVTLRRVKEVPPDQRATTPVQAVACPLDELPVARGDDPLVELLPRMAGCSDGRAPVVDDDRLVGLVSPTDVMRQLEVAELRDARAAHHI